MSSGIKNTLHQEAQKLYETDSRYVDARLQNDWKAIYSFQHPEYQKAISFEEFKYFVGHVTVNYRENKNFQRNVSGFAIYPSVEDIKRNPVKKDHFSGVPLPPLYRFIPNPLIHVTGHKFKNIYIDDSGTLGKASIMLNILQKFPPSLRAGDLAIKRKVLYIDHWKKINGKWVLALMKQFPGQHISGAVSKEHPVPKDISRWETAHFTEFKPEDLK